MTDYKLVLDRCGYWWWSPIQTGR